MEKKRKSMEICNGKEEETDRRRAFLWHLDNFRKMREEAEAQFEEIFDPQKKPPSANDILFGGSDLAKKMKISRDEPLLLCRSKERVKGVSDDVLMEILVRMPPKSVFKCWCLSKRWNASTKNPFFLRSYAKRRIGSSAGRLLGFAQIKTVYTCTNPYLPLEPPIRILPRLGGKRFAFPRTLGCFISSSNCLVLCGKQPVTYNVLNLLTKRWVTLPSPHNEHLRVNSVELVCEEENTTQVVTHYKVVRICAPTDFGLGVDGKFTIQTYSSKTGRWAESVLATACTFPCRLFYVQRVLNGVFHSTTMKSFIAVYDPNEIGGENHFQLIEKPLAVKKLFSSVFSRSSDGLLWCGTYTGPSMQIWMLPKGENGYKSSRRISAKEWRLVHTVSLDSLCKDYSAITYLQARLGNQCDDLFMLGLSPWNPHIVLFRIQEAVFLYNSQSKSLERVPYHDQPTFDPVDEYLWLPYFESPFLSLYALQ